MQADERVRVQPVAARGAAAVDQRHLDVGLGHQSIDEAEATGARSDDQIVGEHRVTVSASRTRCQWDRLRRLRAGYGRGMGPEHLTRRRFLNVAAAAALAPAGLDRLAGSAPLGRLREPRRIYSRGGVLTLALEADEGMAFVAGERRRVLVYDGSFPGPTLVVDPGDRIRLEARQPAA